MKKLLLLLFVPIIGFGQEEKVVDEVKEEKIINAKDLKVRKDWNNGVKRSYNLVSYYKGTKESVTGKVKYLDKKSSGYKGGYVIVTLKDGLKEGVSRGYYENGQLRGESMYSNDRIDGKGKSWHENGQLKLEFTYKNFKPFGVWKEYYDNGQLKSEETYSNGKKNGTWNTRDKNGKLYSQETWSDGQFISNIFYTD